ncbi:MAG: hypothetical protein ACO3O0_03610 [Bacteroidia bacterium]
MKYTLFVLLLIAFNVQVTYAQFYEGQLSNRQFVWMELLPVSKDSSVSGAFFNKQTGMESALSGKMIQAGQLKLDQKSKSGEVLGVFQIKISKDSIVGTWVRTSSKTPVPVKLYRSNNSFKSLATLPASEKLLMSNGDTLSARMKKLRDPNGPAATMIVTYTQHGLLSISFFTYHHTFNLKNNKEVVLKNEIDPSKMGDFLKTLSEAATKQIQLFKESSGLSEEEWIEALGSQQAYEQSFQKANILSSHLDQYFVDANGIHILVNGYLGLKGDLTSLDANLELVLSMEQLRPYLKTGSSLLIN